MENYEVADILKHTAKLMELHGENTFKIRSFQNASFKLDKLIEKLEGKNAEELEKIDGIGKSLSTKIHQLLTEGTFSDLEKYLKITPVGVQEMMELKGIGPKKVAVLWHELGLESIGELLYACNENRLVELKGFGVKTQEQVKQAIEFKMSNQGLFHYAAAEHIAKELYTLIKKKFPVSEISFTGDLRRKCEIVNTISLIISDVFTEDLKSLLEKSAIINPENISIEADHIKALTNAGPSITIFTAAKNDFAYRLWITTGSVSHIEQCLQSSGKSQNDFASAQSENEIYGLLGMDFIEPELREGLNEIEWAKNKTLPVLVELNDLKGILHNHSNWSDGLHSLEEMARACKDSGYEYLGMCDHSKTAVYANGLSIERVIEQHKEIDRLNKELAPFKIFKGIESDILTDGSLDYPDEILSTFDFIVASIHSGLKMDEEKATERLLKAIKNKHTTILGHPTGRLLLARKGYPIDHKKIIDACAEHRVIVELNAHPYRLDLDWRWIQYAVSKGVKISINPDAHTIEGYKDMYYGVCAARKGALTKIDTFNAMSLQEIEKWFQKRKQ